MNNSNISTLLEAAAFLDQRDVYECIEDFTEDELSDSQTTLSILENLSEKKSVHEMMAFSSTRKRMHHNELERKRRKELRKRFENLRKLIPCTQRRCSIQQLLTNSLAYIKFLTAQQALFLSEQLNVEKSNVLLNRKLLVLQGTNSNANEVVGSPCSLSDSSVSSFVTATENDGDTDASNAEARNLSSSCSSSSDLALSSDMSDCSSSSLASAADSSEKDYWSTGESSLHATSSSSPLNSSNSVPDDDNFIDDCLKDEDDDMKSEDDDADASGDTGSCESLRNNKFRRRHRRPSCSVSFCEQYLADMVVKVETDQNDSKKNEHLLTFMGNKSFKSGQQIMRVS